MSEDGCRIDVLSAFTELNLQCKRALMCVWAVRTLKFIKAKKKR